VRKVIHLIPYDGIGGVEIAAKSILRVVVDDVDFRVETIFPPAAASSRRAMLNSWWFLRTVVSLLRAKPDVLIVSLWRAYAVGVLLKLLRPRFRLVLFLHFPNDVHGLDRFFTRLAARFSSSVWADSHETLMRRLPKMQVDKGRVISFVTERIPALFTQSVRPVFVFWGRIHPQKGLVQSLSIFAAVRAEQPLARFLVIGPDGGDLSRVRELACTLGLGDSVNFLGPMSYADIRQVAGDASFYLQTSELEGMAMSVVEAMQLGLVPVVTPVGEISHYAQHGENAVVVKDDATAVADVLSLLEDDARYQAMRQGAVATWVDQPLYKDSVLAACREELGIMQVTEAL